MVVQQSVVRFELDARGEARDALGMCLYAPGAQRSGELKAVERLVRRKTHRLAEPHLRKLGGLGATPTRGQICA